MSDKTNFMNGSSDNSENLYSILKDCVHRRSIDSLTDDFDCGSSIGQEYSSFDNFKMISMSDSFGDDILEDNGRISLAYENLRSIPKKIAEKFATKTKCLDLSYNNFQNLSFLTFFDRLHTLILDRNPNLDVHTLPFLPNLQILWINNCDIAKLDDWLRRLQDQCPNIRHLSMMGNHGETSLITYPDNSYRDYVFNLLPNLNYLDGVARESSDRDNLQSVHFRSSTPKSTSSSCSTKKSPATLKLCELFRFKRKKKLHHNAKLT